MKLKIDDTEYTIIPIPPSLSPYSTHISEMLKLKPQGIEDADKISLEIEKAMEKLLAGTVKPTPPKDHHIQIFNALINLTNKVLEEAGLFRQDSRSNIKKSNTIGFGSPQKTKRSPSP